MKNKLVIETNSADTLFEDYRYELSKALIKGVEWGIRYKKEVVPFAKIIINNFIVVELSIYKEDFNFIIDENIKTLVEAEEYESCALGMKLKQKLNKQL
jgi:hypothetical protein